MIICLPGWTGPDCCENIDDCSPNPCVYAESCIDAVAGYFCSCRAGYEVSTMIKIVFVLNTLCALSMHGLSKYCMCSSDTALHAVASLVTA